MEAFTEHINAVDSNINFTQEDVRGCHSLPLLDCAVHIVEGRSLNIEVYRKSIHRSIFAFDTHHPLENKLGVIRTLNHRAESVHNKSEGKENEHKHIRGALKTFGYPNWTFVRTSIRSRADREKETRKRNNIAIPFVTENF